MVGCKEGIPGTRPVGIKHSFLAGQVTLPHRHPSLSEHDQRFTSHTKNKAKKGDVFIPKWEHSGNFHLAKEKGLRF
jgi:hypothetical protein